MNHDEYRVMLALHQLGRAATTYEIAEASHIPPRVAAQILRNNQHSWVEKCGEVQVKGKPILYPTFLWMLVGNPILLATFARAKCF